MLEVVHKQKKIFIDLIGYPGAFKEAFTLERYKALERAGVHCFPLHYSYWQKAKKAAIQKLVGFIV